MMKDDKNKARLDNSYAFWNITGLRAEDYSFEEREQIIKKRCD